MQSAKFSDSAFMSLQPSGSVERAVVRLTGTSPATETITAVGRIATGSAVVEPVLADSTHSLLARLISEVEQRLLTCFEEGAFTTRERINDPDSTSTPLFIVVHTKMEPTTARAALERFDQTWWLDQAYLTAGLLEVALAYGA